MSPAHFTLWLAGGYADKPTTRGAWTRVYLDQLRMRGYALHPTTPPAEPLAASALASAWAVNPDWLKDYSRAERSYRQYCYQHRVRYADAGGAP